MSSGILSLSSRVGPDLTNLCVGRWAARACRCERIMVHLQGIGPCASSVSRKRSTNELKMQMVVPVGIEPTHRSV